VRIILVWNGTSRGSRASVERDGVLASMRRYRRRGAHGQGVRGPVAPRLRVCDFSVKDRSGTGRDDRAACAFYGGLAYFVSFQIYEFVPRTPAKTTRKAIAMRFKASPCVLDCIKGSYAGLFRGFNFNHVILSLKSKLHFSFACGTLLEHHKPTRTAYLSTASAGQGRSRAALVGVERP
jgi:hypothetical protein